MVHADLQKKFMSDVAHDLRTPISVIKINTELVLINDSLSKKSQDLLASNIEELDRMSKIISQALNS